MLCKIISSENAEQYEAGTDSLSVFGEYLGCFSGDIPEIGTTIEIVNQKDNDSIDHYRVIGIHRELKLIGNKRFNLELCRVLVSKTN